MWVGGPAVEVLARNQEYVLKHCIDSLFEFVDHLALDIGPCFVVESVCPSKPPWSVDEPAEHAVDAGPVAE